ncbi:hypothetical protein GCM10025870_01920 [Agromyces marinus]|uniref:Uncharacterized protein n=1 Tax=Agromyces marinus TaxID=1389020 RepID=A0ABM8GXC8_9MICO|nr:hypothetical protein GCM10025870_01920 [Agromyces marinus]
MPLPRPVRRRDGGETDPHRAAQGIRCEHAHLRTVRGELVREHRLVGVVQPDHPGILVGLHGALAQAHLGVRAGAHGQIGRIREPQRLQVGERAVLDVGGRRIERGSREQADVADDAREQEGPRRVGVDVAAVQMPAPLVQDDRVRLDRARSGRVLAGLEVVEADALAPVERLPHRFEGGIPHSQARRVADHGLPRFDAERAELGEGALRIGRERRLAPDLGRQAEQRQFVGREAHIHRQVVLALGDAVPQRLVVTRAIRGLDRLERDAEVADLVLVALELPLEVRVAAVRVVPFGVPAHGREDLRLQQAVLGREQREHEAEQSILDRDPSLPEGLDDATSAIILKRRAATPQRSGHATPRMSITKNSVEPAGMLPWAVSP